uniref:hypothetical protein n=1 Tax=Parasutterella excrementihominis TaxID=487175 RepID=UPI00272DFA97
LKSESPFKEVPLPLGAGRLEGSAGFFFCAEAFTSADLDAADAPEEPAGVFFFNVNLVRGGSCF